MKEIHNSQFTIFKHVVLLVIGYCVLAIAHQVFAATASPSATVKKVTYPVTIPAVGTCADWAACRTLCADPVNTLACETWAAGQGLIKPKREVMTQAIFSQAQTQLGCTSAETCREVCSKKENYDKCAAFAQARKIGGGYDQTVVGLSSRSPSALVNDPRIKEYIAKLLPGSATGAPVDLKSLCAEQQNQQICTAIAQKLGVAAGVVKSGPGGCMTDASCKQFCDEPQNADTCKTFQANHPLIPVSGTPRPSGVMPSAGVMPSGTMPPSTGLMPSESGIPPKPPVYTSGSPIPSGTKYPLPPPPPGNPPTLMVGQSSTTVLPGSETWKTVQAYLRTKYPTISQAQLDEYTIYYLNNAPKTGTTTGTTTTVQTTPATSPSTSGAPPAERNLLYPPSTTNTTQAIPSPSQMQQNTTVPPPTTTVPTGLPAVHGASTTWTWWDMLKTLMF